MSGNTRGKLKEHFEGMHRNLDWCIVHCDKCLTLIAAQLSFTNEMLAVKGDAEKEEQVLMEYPLYRAIKSMGEGIQTFDELANSIYADL